MKKADWNKLITSHSTEFDAQDTLDKLLGFGVVTALFTNTTNHGDVILDFGCGAGRYERTLTQAQDGLKIFGYDPAPTAIKLAKEEAYPTQCTFENKLVNRQYDAAVANFVLCTMPNMKSTLEQIAKVLRPGAHLIACEPHPEAGGHHFGSYHPEKPLSFVDGAPYKVNLNGMEPFIDYWHPKSAYRDLLLSAGFIGIKFEEQLALTTSEDWKDERFQAPYLHICARKI